MARPGAGRVLRAVRARRGRAPRGAPARRASRTAIEADLALGRHADVVGELEALRARGIRCARRCTASSCSRSTARAATRRRSPPTTRYRRTLDEELGIEPSGGAEGAAVPDPQPGPASSTLAAAADRATGRRRRARAAPRPAAAAASSSGRADELARSSGRSTRRGDGHGSTVLIAGPAGIGKTRLVAELAERARARGRDACSPGRCIQLVGAGLPVPPARRGAAPARGSRGAAQPRRRAARAAAARPAARPRTRRGRRGTVGDSRLRLFEEVLAVLDRLGAAHPVVLVLEDLHWADESTLDLVAFLAHAVPDRRILLVRELSQRRGPPGDHLHRLATGLVGGRAVTALQLEPLAPRGRRARCSSRAAPSTLPAELVAAIVARSEGNPFFADELLRRRAARRDGASAGAAGRAARPARPRLDADEPRGAPRRGGRRPGRPVRAAGRRAAARRARARGGAAPGRRARRAGPGPAPARSASATRSSPRRSTPRCCPASARWSTSGSRAPSREEPGSRRRRDRGRARRSTGSPRAGPSRRSTASLRAAREAEAVSGLTEALRHVERVLELWDEVPDAEELAGVALPAVLAWAAELAGRPCSERTSSIAARARRHPRPRRVARRRTRSRRGSA